MSGPLDLAQINAFFVHFVQRRKLAQFVHYIDHFCRHIIYFFFRVKAAQAEAHKLPPDRIVRDVFLSEQPNRKFATVSEIAGTVSFLCGPAAASITGTTIAVDGGWTAH